MAVEPVTKKRRRETDRRLPRIQGNDEICRQLRQNEFKTHFRLFPSTVVEIMKEISKEFLVRHKYEMKLRGVLLSLWYFANREGFREMTERFGMSVGAAYRTVSEFCKALNNNKNLSVRWPSGDEVLQTFEGFNSHYDNAFPGVIGAIDGCHIRILAPWELRKKMPQLDRKSFLNRKQVSSILLQGICNANLEFISAFAGMPGSCNDILVFRKSEIGEALLNQPGFLPPEFHVIGDNTYPLLNTLLTPYNDTGNLTKVQLHYNHKLISTRVIIEQAFGKLLGRFHRLKLLDVYNKDLGGLYIMTCCILHNVCQRLGDDISPVDYESAVPPQSFPIGTPSGAQKRNRIAKQLFYNDR